MATAKSKYLFDDHYRETATLNDGTTVLLRTMRPSDRDLLVRGFETLSPQSRYFRFLTTKPSLTEEELAQLTAVDGINHFALAAVSTDPAQSREGLGVARFVRLEQEPEMAEAAITVIDPTQNRGLGTLLMTRLAAAARERGIKHITCEFFASNQRIRHALAEHAPGAQFTENERGDLIRAVVPIPDISLSDLPSAAKHLNAIYRIMGDAARGAVRVRLRRLLLKHGDD